MSNVNDVTTIILAGGIGTRLRAHYPNVPKPMIPIAGKPFLYWLTAWLSSFGLDQFVYSTGHQAEQIASWCSRGDFPQLARTCRQETEALGTGGGLLNCLDLCRDYVLVANGDSLVIGPIDQLLQLRTCPTLDGALIGLTVEDATRYGSLTIDGQRKLVGFREKAPGSGLINGGLYLFRTDFLRSFYRSGYISIEHELLPQMIESGAGLLVVSVGEAAFIDIGTPESLKRAESFVEANLSAHFLANPQR